MTRETLSPLGERIEFARKRRGFATSQALADAAGINPGQLSKLKSGERGARSEAATLEKLARALNVRTEWLRTGELPMDRPITVDEMAPYDMTIGEFLLKIGDGPHSLPGLAAEIRRKGSWKLRTVIRAAGNLLECEEDGMPKGGWAQAFRMIESNPTPSADEAISRAKEQAGNRPEIPGPKRKAAKR